MELQVIGCLLQVIPDDEQFYQSTITIFVALSYAPTEVELGTVRVFKSNPLSYLEDHLKWTMGNLFLKQDHIVLVGHGQVKWPIRVALISGFC